VNGIDLARGRLERLIQQGQHLLSQSADPRSTAQLAGDIRLWQNDCATVINELSGGAKSHWLARAFSNALLVRDGNGAAREDAPIAEIVSRITAVLDQAHQSLGRWQDTPAEISASPPHRFDFVRDARLRPLLEAAFIDSRHAAETGHYSEALMTTCSVLEAIVTDALTHQDPDLLAKHGGPESSVSAWPFDVRLTVAERSGLIRGGCARLPPIARHYRDGDAGAGLDSRSVSERDARVTGQVLRVVMRDLDPGR